MRFPAAMAAALLDSGTAIAQAASSGPTLSAIHARGSLICGSRPGAPGFRVLDGLGVTRGLDADTCRAIAGAVLGDAAKARFVVLSSQARLPAPQSGQVDGVRHHPGECRADAGEPEPADPPPARQFGRRRPADQRHAAR